MGEEATEGDKLADESRMTKDATGLARTREGRPRVNAATERLANATTVTMLGRARAAINADNSPANAMVVGKLIN